MSESDRFSLDQLEQAADVPGRQIRELIRVGILPAPSSRGRGATYGPEHLERLRAWKRLRRESPQGTTNDQLRVLLDRLQHAGVLTGVAEGTVPIALIDDSPGEGGAAVSEPPFSVLSRAVPSLRATGRPNERALQYLSSMEPAGPPRPPVAARLTYDASALTPTLEVDLRASEHSSAGLLLQRLRAALDAFITGAGKGTAVRVNPTRSDAWHRVAVGRDLEISARAPLTPEEIQLLETVGQLLQQAIYRRDKQP